MPTELLQMAGGIIFFASLATTSVACSRRLLPDAPLIARLPAGCIIFAWLLSALAALLLPLHAFTCVPAVVASLLCLAVAVHLAAPAELAAAVAKDMRSIRAAARDVMGTAPGRLMTIAFAFLVLWLVLRALCLPILGWDSLTYHSLKAGLWVQEGGWSSLEAPGGWEYYRTFFGGGEVFTAWTLLFFRTGLLAALPDVFFWLLLGVTIAGLARHGGLAPRLSILVGLAFISVEEFVRLVGSGYIDTCANALLLGGLLMLLHAGKPNRTVLPVLAGAALGVSASTKLNACAMSLAVGAAAGTYLLVTRRVSLRACVYAALAIVVPVLPWLLHNVATTGYVLGGAPLRVGPLVLGVAPPNLAWLMDRPDLVPYRPLPEARAMLVALKAFGPSLLLTLLGVPGLWAGFFGRRPACVLGACVSAVAVGLFMLPGFTVIRFCWPHVNGRFLAPAVLLPAAVGIPWLAARRTIGPMLEWLSVICLATGMATFVRTSVLYAHPVEFILPAAAAVTTALVWGTIRLRAAQRMNAWMLAALTALAALGLLSAAHVTRDRLRLRAYMQCTTLHDFPRYFVPALAALEVEERPARIAFTYGPWQVSHGAFLAPFLGARLENRVVYVSPETDGHIPAHHPDALARSVPDPDHWEQALEAAGATHVLCLRPPCVELAWAQGDPEHFVRITGADGDWGLFRFKP